MELDDLKKSWNSQPNETSKNINIMELIGHKSYGPVAALKRGFRRQMRIMILMPLFIFIINSRNGEGPVKSILFWAYVGFCIAAVVFFYINYRIASRMEVMEGAVKANLEKQTLLLEQRLRWKTIGLPIATLFFALLVEVLPYVQHYKMLNTWHNLSPFIRFGAYAFVLLFQYIVSRLVSERRFGAHLRHLKNLVKEMRD
jgi:hypothetical protein